MQSNKNIWEIGKKIFCSIGIIYFLKYVDHSLIPLFQFSLSDFTKTERRVIKMWLEMSAIEQVAFLQKEASILPNWLNI